MEAAENYRRDAYRLGGATSRDGTGRWVARSDDWDRWRALVETSRDGCWRWRGRRTRDGYPLFDIRGPQGWTPVRAHRWAWEQTHGPLPARWTLDHTCHTRDLDCPGGATCPHRACVQLDHLEPVTAVENLRRRHARRRAGTQEGNSR